MGWAVNTAESLTKPMDRTLWFSHSDPQEKNRWEVWTCMLLVTIFPARKKNKVNAQSWIETSSGSASPRVRDLE